MIKKAYNDKKFAFPFIAFLPERIEGKLPLILQLHGAGERGEGGEELELVCTHGFARVLKNGKDYNCIMVMPQCPKDSFWAARVESILRFIEQLKGEFDINEDKITLTGLSMGGFGTWFTAMARPDIFAAIAPVCGGGMSWCADKLTMPVWAFHGTSDPVVPVFHSDSMVEKMRELGLDVKYTRLDGVGHGAWVYAYKEELLLWLLEKGRKSTNEKI